VKPVLGVDFRNKAFNRSSYLSQKIILVFKISIATYLLSLHDPGFKHSRAPGCGFGWLLCHLSLPEREELQIKCAQEFLGIAPEDLNQLKFSKWNQYREKLVVLKTVSFQHKKGFQYPPFTAGN
jgi:hypothetical protein